jgi:hypothetical protein
MGSLAEWAVPGSNGQPPACKARARAAVVGTPASRLALARPRSVGDDVLREMTHEAAEAILAARWTGGVRGASLCHAPLERPRERSRGRDAGFAMGREMDDTDEAGDVVRAKEWELTVELRAHTEARRLNAGRLLLSASRSLLLIVRGSRGSRDRD